MLLVLIPSAVVIEAREVHALTRYRYLARLGFRDRRATRIAVANSRDSPMQVIVVLATRLLNRAQA